ncbi:unnamed protein product [Rotaria socialis]|uniref:Fork-head domain-containing protein n=1 Tax=Rotaria socialis TaxID=392032 RepID=A0A818T551_9BILA|nr:unnamed protein product [Rotaria socialis]CAF4374472.1 unnamed protein product [Rotaria socialis]
MSSKNGILEDFLLLYITASTHKIAAYETRNMTEEIRLVDLEVLLDKSVGLTHTYASSDKCSLQNKIIMFNEEDECDSSNILTVASQSDVIAFLQAQEAKIIGLHTNVSDYDDDDEDDELSIVHSSIPNFKQISSNNHSQGVKSYLSHSCFASISNSSAQKQTTSDDLTELNWLNTFKFKETKTKEKSTQEIDSNEDQISKLCNELKMYNEENLYLNSLSFGVLIFLALYSKRYDKQTPWLLTIKQLYDYIQKNKQQISHRRGWRDLLKETLIKIPCFVKTKRDILKSRSVWTIDPYYRPLLTRAYLTRSSLQSNKTISTNQNEVKDALSDEDHYSKSIINYFAPKSTVKTKVLPRLYERLCEEEQNYESENEIDLNNPIEEISKRPCSTTTTTNQYQFSTNECDTQLSASLPLINSLTKRKKIYSNIGATSNNEAIITTPCPSIDHMYLNSIRKSTEFTGDNEISIDENNQCYSYSLTNSIQKSNITTRAQAIAEQNMLNKDIVDRRKSGSLRKPLSLSLPLHRPNTRMSRKIIEQDLELLRKANNN